MALHIPAHIPSEKDADADRGGISIGTTWASQRKKAGCHQGLDGDPNPTAEQISMER